jgi:Xaa-Pro aminopeptidase
MLYNKERLCALMDSHGLDGVVATTAESILYLSGFASWSQGAYKYGNSQSFVVFPRDPAKSHCSSLAVTEKGSEYLSSPRQQKLHSLPLS